MFIKLKNKSRFIFYFLHYHPALPTGQVFFIFLMLQIANENDRYSSVITPMFLVDLDDKNNDKLSMMAKVWWQKSLTLIFIKDSVRAHLLNLFSVEVKDVLLCQLLLVVFQVLWNRLHLPLVRLLIPSNITATNIIRSPVIILSIYNLASSI